MAHLVKPRGFRESALPSLKIIDRTSKNCWEDAAVVAEINLLGNSRAVIGGLWTGLGVVYAAKMIKAS